MIDIMGDFKRKIAFSVGLFLLSLPVLSQTVSVAKFWGDRRAAVSLTFDDGIQEHFTLVAPHLDAYALKGTFGINGLYVGDLDDHFAPRLTWEKCRQMAANGHEICNHSWSHPNLMSVDSCTLVSEVSKNDSIIEAEIGVRPTSFLYPFNAVTSSIQPICEKGKVGSRLQQFALGQRNSRCTASSIYTWLRHQIERNLWGITMTHGIYTAWDQWDDPWVLWDFFRRLAFKKDSVWIDTFSNIQAYVKERDSVQLTISYKDKILMITPALHLDSTIFRMPLTLKIGGIKQNRFICAMQGGKKLQVTNRGKYSTVDINPYGAPIEVSYVDEKGLEGKTFCVIGDSYVYNHGCPLTETWHYKIAAKHKMKYLNFGKNGNCIAFERDSLYGVPLYKRYKVIPKNVDYILFIAGHNDAYLVNEDKVKQALLRQRMNQLLKNIKNTYPHAKIGWVTPWNVAYEGFPITIRIIEEVCMKNGVSLLNAAYTSGINPNDSVFRLRYFQGKEDTAHLNNAGHNLLLDFGEQFIMGL